MAFDAAQILRQTYAAGAEAAQMAQSLAREEPAPAQVQRGEINGTSFVVESDPLAELQDSMEELSFQFEEKTAKRLAERKMGPLQGMRASFIKALEAWRALMPDMPGNDALKKTMQNIREMLRSGSFAGHGADSLLRELARTDFCADSRASRRTQATSSRCLTSSSRCSARARRSSASSCARRARS